jgi:hypothetical protein
MVRDIVATTRFTTTNYTFTAEHKVGLLRLLIRVLKFGTLCYCRRTNK